MRFLAVFCGAAILLCSAADARQKLSENWFAVSIAEYRTWRKTLVARPKDARHRVLQAIERTNAAKDTVALSAPKPQKMSRADFEQRVLRDRGLLVWRTLETVIDRERVDRALQLYDERYSHDGVAAFRRACEEISGRNLKWFFDYYVDGRQLPEISLRRISGTAPNEVSGEIIVKNVPAEFQVRVEMRFSTAAGLIEHSVATNGTVTPFTITTRDPVLRVAVDPEDRILKKVR